MTNTSRYEDKQIKIEDWEQIEIRIKPKLKRIIKAADRQSSSTMKMQPRPRNPAKISAKVTISENSRCKYLVSFNQILAHDKHSKFIDKKINKRILSSYTPLSLDMKFIKSIKRSSFSR